MVRRALWLAGGSLFVWYVVVPLFERFAPPEAVRRYQRLTMPFFRPLAGIVPGFGVVETVGRKSGRRHQVPVGGRLDADMFWFVAGIGRRTHYIRNIEAHPRVRVKVLGRWRDGTAHIVTDDDARRRALRVNPTNGIFLVTANGNADALTVRVDLDR